MALSQYVEVSDKQVFSCVFPSFFPLSDLVVLKVITCSFKIAVRIAGIFVQQKMLPQLIVALHNFAQPSEVKHISVGV